MWQDRGGIRDVCIGERVMERGGLLQVYVTLYGVRDS